MDPFSKAKLIRSGFSTGNMQPPQIPSGEAGHESHSLDHLAFDMKWLVKKIQDLSHLGIEDNTIALPKICVVGDQSTGKSSLIEGISEINVPRSSGTCTRCPMEINLSESEPGEGWSCSVFLSRGYWYDPSKRLTAGTKRSDTLGPWVPFDGQEAELFLTLTDKRMVKETIEWAQRAILNPSTDPQNFVPGKNANTSGTVQVKFSPNVVRLDIAGPNYPALSFYDLPGVISQAEQDDETYLVQLVEKLVRRYVSQENCIVLLALPMTDDATNFSAASILRNIKGAKERTLGVLTKPDRLPDHESFEQWNEVLEGKKSHLGHGYFVVRNNPDPDVSHSQARQEEEEFFADPFWAGQAHYQQRFGTHNLQTALSSLLREQILKCLPSIVRQIDEKATRIDTELSTLPGPPQEDYQYILVEKTTTLGLKLNLMFEGGTGPRSPTNKLQRDWNHIVMDFQQALAATRPTVRTGSESDNIFLAPKYDQDADMIIVSSSPRLKRKAPATEPNAPDNSTPQKAHVGRPNAPAYKTEVFQHWQGPAIRFSLERIQSIKEESRRAGIPNHIDPGALEALERECVEHWHGLAVAFVNSVHGAVRGALLRNLDEVVAQYRQTNLYRELYRIMDSYPSQLQEEFLTVATAHSAIEHEMPFTMANAQHEQATKTALEALTISRTQSRNRCYWKLRGYADDEDVKFPKLTPEELGPDPFTQEIGLMAVSFFPMNSTLYKIC